jgi:hypothetical protein
MLLIIAILCAYAGFAALCAVTRRNVRLVWKTPPKPATVNLVRAAGWVFIFLAWAPCILMWGWAMGTVAWVCSLPIAALVLILPFTYAARRSVMAGGAAAALAVVLALTVVAMGGHGL